MFALFFSNSEVEIILIVTYLKIIHFVSGGDNDVVSNYFSRKSKKYGLLSLFNYLKDTLFVQRSKKTF